ncbi:hypothetical protein LTR08_006824 [Meristemomyces frigidus]|nr:hypothetical protein LTR08_006824 [Meristemomyces frigidus]
MLGRSVGIAATCALGASAFMVLPGIATSAATDLSNSVVNPKEQVITVPCSECAFPAKQEKIEDFDEEDWFWIQGGANSLVLNFTVSEDGQRLQLNGGDIYPSRFEQEGLSLAQQPIYVKQVPSKADLVEVRSGKVQSTDLEVTAYGLKEAEMEPLSPDGGDLLVSIKFDIMELENERVHVDEVAIKLLKTGEGELLIMQVEEDYPSHDSPSEAGRFPPPTDLDFPPPPPHHGPPHHGPPHHGPPPHGEPAECDVLPAALCKLKAMIDSKIEQAMSHRGGPPKMGGCHGRKGPHDKHMPGHIKPHLGRPGQDGPPKFHHGRPHHMRPHGPHHGPPPHSFMHAFARGAVAVLIPVMAGIAVGMSVSLLGLVVGRLISLLWIRFARGGRRGSASMVALEEGEDDGMLAEMEAPPVYEQAPAYAETEKEQV